MTHLGNELGRWIHSAASSPDGGECDSLSICIIYNHPDSAHAAWQAMHDRNGPGRTLDIHSVRTIHIGSLTDGSQQFQECMELALGAHVLIVCLDPDETFHDSARNWFAGWLKHPKRRCTGLFCTTSTTTQPGLFPVTKSGEHSGREELRSFFQTLGEDGRLNFTIYEG